MKRVLIAQEKDCFAENLIRCLQKDFILEHCPDGGQVLRTIREFDPDVILMDTSLPGSDPVSVLHMVRTAGSMAHFVVTTVSSPELVRQRLGDIGVARIFPKPCCVDAVCGLLYRLTADLPDLSLWCAETEAENVLLHMGFHCGRSRYDCIYHGILLKYCDKGGDSAKYLYSEVRKLCGKRSVEVVEKAIRDAIRHAWNHGDPEIWRLYFPLCHKEGCPSNEVFISRIALALKNRERLKKVYEPQIARLG